MTEAELKKLNYKKGGNNYIQKSNLSNHWVAFTKRMVDKLKSQYDDDFNIIIYWNREDDLVDYVSIPMSYVSHLFTEECLSKTSTGSPRWNFIIDGNLLCGRGNKNYSIDISIFRNNSILSYEQLQYNKRSNSRKIPSMRIWIIPSNTNRFDIVGALEKFGFIDWKQNNNFSKGDIVYMYVTKPDQRIRYRFCITDVDLTFEESENNLEFWRNENDFYSAKEQNRYCRFVLNGEFDGAELDLKTLLTKGLTQAPQGPITVTEELSNYIESFFNTGESKISFIDEVESHMEFTEGSTSLVTISSRQRNRNARDKCIELMGTVCFVCGFDFEKKYGSMGKGFIHIHHKTPISQRTGNYKIAIESDLVPVCPNCHAMLHKEIDSKYLSVDELKKIINGV